MLRGIECQFARNKALRSVFCVLLLREEERPEDEELFVGTTIIVMAEALYKGDFNRVGGGRNE